VSAQIVYHFEWDAAKARSSLRKHGVSFRAATAVFRDPLALTTYDDEHSETEERWVTLGRTENGQYLVVVHTFAQVSEVEIHVRVISARTADHQEIRDYEQAPR
jgi:uncharacterized DUF497 family protein